MSKFKAFLNSPVGLKTVHFWGPAFNWFFVLQGVSDYNRKPEHINARFQSTMVIYSTLFMRFAIMVNPQNMFLFSCHFFNFWLQGRLLAVRLHWNYVEGGLPSIEAMGENLENLKEDSPVKESK